MLLYYALLNGRVLTLFALCWCYSVLDLWKKDLCNVNERAAEALADPEKYPNLFPDLEWALQVESIFKAGRGTVVPAGSYITAKEELDLNLIDLVKNAAAGNSESTEEAEVVGDSEPAAQSEEQLAEEATPVSAPASPTKAASPAPASPTKAASPAPASPAKAASPAPASPVAAVAANTSVEEDDLDALIAHADDLLIDDAGEGDAGEIDLDELGEDGDEAWA